jgi:hypothetical protein
LVSVILKWLNATYGDEKGCDIGRNFWRALCGVGFIDAPWFRLGLDGALGCTGFLAALFTWRAAAGWMAYSAGEPKLFAASLISLMLAGSLVSIGVLVKNR